MQKKQQAGKNTALDFNQKTLYFLTITVKSAIAFNPSAVGAIE